jgi:hypothetical protein
MASKNLGAVIQRAISDGAFRRQLQSDPATALRGFNLTPDEVAAIRSGDSGKLISLGVDQRMSKVFAVSGMQGGAARQSVSDLAAGSTSSTIANDPTSGAREGIVGDPTSGQRSALDTDASGNTRSAFTPGDVASTSDAHTTGSLSGTRAIIDNPPFDSGRLTVADAGSGAAGNVIAADSNESYAPSFHSGGLNQAASAATGGDAGGSGGNMLAADDNYAVSSRMAESGDAISIRPIHDDAPFEGNANAAAPSGNEFLGANARLDPSTDATHTAMPGVSADELPPSFHSGDGPGSASIESGNTGGVHQS